MVDEVKPKRAASTKTQHKPKFYRKKYFWQSLLVCVIIMLIVPLMYYRHVANEEKQLLTRQGRYQEEIQKTAKFIMQKEPRVWPTLATEIATAVVNASYRYNVPLDLLVGVKCKESQGYPFALSKTGAVGVMQVDFAAHREEFPVKHEWQKYQPEYNVSCAAWKLQGLIRKHGLKKALTLYNVGEGNYQRGVRNVGYVEDVFELASEFRYFER